MVIDPFELRRFRQQFVQMGAPAGRIQRVAVVVGGSIIQDVLYATLYPLGRLCFGGPDGGQDLVRTKRARRARPRDGPSNPRAVQFDS